MNGIVTCFLLAAAAAAAAEPEKVFAVQNGAHPWHDRIDVWQLADVPPALQSDALVPQQSCGSRRLRVPEGTQAITMALGAGDLARIRSHGFPIRETNLSVTIQSPQDGRKIPYPVIVYTSPPVEIAFDGKCTSGLVLLRLNADGIESSPPASPAASDDPPPKTLAERSSFHLYLLVGQSNMAGRGTVEAQDRVMNPRVLTLDRDGQWVVALDPIHFDKPVAGVGLGTTFGKSIAANDPTIVVGLIPCAAGGTRVAQWQKDAPPTPPWGQLYGNAVTRVRLALRDGVLKGILWHQGEGDSSEAATAAYKDLLTRLVADLRQDLEAPDVPFVAGCLGVWDPVTHAGRQRFNENLNRLPEWIHNSTVVSADGVGHVGDGTHFDSPALRELGRRYAAALLRLRGEQPPTP